jgi:hypothetical protein
MCARREHATAAPRVHGGGISLQERRICCLGVGACPGDALVGRARLPRTPCRSARDQRGPNEPAAGSSGTSLSSSVRAGAPARRPRYVVFSMVRDDGVGGRLSAEAVAQGFASIRNPFIHAPSDATSTGSSRPVRRGSPTLGRFDSCAAPCSSKPRVFPIFARRQTAFLLVAV